MAEPKRLGRRLRYDVRGSAGAVLSRALVKSGLSREEFRLAIEDMSALPVPPDMLASFLAGETLPTRDVLLAAEALAGAAWSLDDTDEQLAREAGAATRDRVARTIELASTAVTPDGNAAALDGLQFGVDLLCREYSIQPPEQLIVRAQQRLWQVERQRDARRSIEHQRRLLELGAWLYLLLGALHFDIGDLEAAEIARDTAFHLGTEIGNTELQTWSLETAAYFSVFTKRLREAVDLCVAGQRLTPRGTSAAVATTMQEARARARLHERREAEAALARGYSAIERLPQPAHPEHHFMWDAPKFSYYATTTYGWLQMPKQTERYALETIELFSDSGGPNWWPGRVAGARLDLGVALVQQHRIDEAAHIGNQALAGYGVRTWIMRRARDLHDALSAHTDVPEVREFRQRYELARNASESLITW